MPQYLRYSKGQTLAIAICQRCKFKRHHFDLLIDPNTKQLVCRFGCKDIFDPYRLQPKKPDDIVIRNPRPDEIIDVPNDYPYGTP